LNLGEEKKVQEICLQAIRRGLVRSAHDVAEGGLGVALAECCIMSPEGLGARIEYPVKKRDDILLFGESQSMILLTVPEERLKEVERMAFQEQLPYTVLGTVGGDSLSINETIDVRVDMMKRAYEGAITRSLEAGDHVKA